MSSLFSRCIFPLWRCSQTAATNGPVNLHYARLSSGCMSSATNVGRGRWIFHHILFLCICLHFVNVPLKWSDFLNCAQLIMVHKQSFKRLVWITSVNSKWVLTLWTLSDITQKYTNTPAPLHSHFRTSEGYEVWAYKRRRENSRSKLEVPYPRLP